MASDSKELAKTETYPLAVMDPARRIELTDLSDELDGESVGMAMFTRVKMPSGGGRTWEIENPDDADKPETPQVIEGVIVHSQRVNGYWSKSLEETGGVAPDCKSDDGVIGQGDRSGGGITDTSPVHECHTCPLNEFGSDPSGGKACKNMWLLFVLRPDDSVPLLLTLSPASLKPYKEFITGQFVKRHRARGTYVVAIGLEKAKSNDNVDYSKATFNFVTPLTPEQAAVTRSIREDLAAFVGSSAAALLTEPAAVTTTDAEIF